MQEQAVRRSAFVLQPWQDEDGRIWGHVQEPMSSWQRPFTGVDNFCLLLLQQLAAHPASSRKLNKTIAHILIMLSLT
jgi:hypothetical protein